MYSIVLGNFNEIEKATPLQNKPIIAFSLK